MTQTFEQLLAEWEALVKAQAAGKKREMDMRKALFAAAFPDPKEGANKFTLADGRELVGTHKLTRTVDETALGAVQEELLKFNDPNAATVFTLKWSVSMGAYNKMDADSAVRKVVDRAVICKPGSPSLEVR